MTSTLQKASEAHKLYTELTELLQMGRMAGVFLGRLLSQLRKDNLFKKAIGSGIETWNDFLKVPEIGMSPSEAQRAIDLFEVFCTQYGYTPQELAEAKTKSLHYLLPLAKTGDVPEERIRELVEDAKHLSQAQFRENIYDARTHDQGSRTYEFVLMRKCKETGVLQRVPGINAEQIASAFKKLNIDLDSLFVPEIL